MIGLDTNVFLRLFVKDNPEQAARARDFVAFAVKADVCYINAVVLAEFVWTLSRRLRRTKPEIMRLIAAALSTDDLEIAHRDCVQRALDSYRVGDADFADYLLAEINRDAGCVTTATFDQEALDSPTFSPVP